MRTSKILPRGATSALALIVVAALGGCGGSSGAASASSGVHAAFPNSNQTQAEAIRVALQYTGGSGGTASPKATPIEIGWANQDAVAPWETTAVKAAFSFINQDLDGVDGQPLRLVEPPNCAFSYRTSNQQVTLCGESLLNNPNIHVIMTGDVPQQEQQLMSVVGANKKAVVIGGNAQTVQAARAPSGFFFGGGDLTSLDYLPVMKAYLHAKSVAQVWPDFPGVQGGADAFSVMLKAYGFNVSTALVPSASTEFVTSLVAAHTASASMILYFPAGPSECIGLAQALKTLRLTSKPVLSTYTTCLSPAVKSALGDYPHWLSESDYPNINVPDPTGQVGTMLFALKKYVGSGWLTVAQGIDGAAGAPQSFGLAMALRKWLGQVGSNKITEGSVSKVIRSYTGAMFLGPPSVKFGVQPLPSVGSIAARFYQYLGDNQWRYVTPWIDGPLSYAKYFGIEK